MSDNRIILNDDYRQRITEVKSEGKGAKEIDLERQKIQMQTAQISEEIKQTHIVPKLWEQHDEAVKKIEEKQKRIEAIDSHLTELEDDLINTEITSGAEQDNIMRQIKFFEDRKAGLVQEKNNYMNHYIRLLREIGMANTMKGGQASIVMNNSQMNVSQDRIPDLFSGESNKTIEIPTTDVEPVSPIKKKAEEDMMALKTFLVDGS